LFEENVRPNLEQFGGTLSEALGETTVRLPREKLLAACRYLKDECGYEMLTDIAGVDNYGEDPRFEVVYHLYSFKNPGWLRLKVSVPEDDLQVDSVTGLWRTADWHEREAFDMYGIRFRNHPNLKRILMWEGYPYYPLRKDFPLAGMDAEERDADAGTGPVVAAPMLGGPFVAGPGNRPSSRREPRQYDTPSEQQEKLK
jgi:NADH-quinone oxidoreductase subunit C